MSGHREAFIGLSTGEGRISPRQHYATLQAATASRGARVTDAQAVRQLCESYCFGLLKWEVTDDEFSIWGDDTFEIYEATDEGLLDYEAGIATYAFLRALAEYVAPEANLDIQTAGYTNCRFPVLAQRFVIRGGEVFHAGLSHLTSVDE